MHWIKGQACQNVYSINRYDKLAWEIHQESRGANQGTLRSTGSAPLLSSLTASLNEEGLLSERCLQTQPRWSRNPIPCFARGELVTLLVIRFARPLRAGKMSIQRLLPHRPSVKVLHGWRMRSSLGQLEHYNYLQKKLDLPLCIKAYSFLNFFESQPTVSVKPATYSIRQSRFGFNCRSEVWTKGAFQPTSEQGLQGFQGLPDSSCSCTGSHSTSTDDSKPSGLWAFTCITYKQRPSTETTEFKT